MAIKKKSEKKEVGLPQALDKIFEKAFTASILEKKFKEEASEGRAEAYSFLDEKREGFDVDKILVSSSFTTRFGRVTIANRASNEIDRDKLIELVESGKVTVATLLNIATFGADKLKTALGEKDFAQVAKVSEGRQSLALYPSSEFRSVVEGAFEEKTETTETKVEVKVEKTVSSLEKIRAAKKSSKTEVADTEKDLEDILNG